MDEGVDHEKNRTGSYSSNCYPAFLFIERLVPPRNGVRIIENQRGRLKTNVMLAKVLPVLDLVPLKSHHEPRPNEEYPPPVQMSIHLYIHTKNPDDSPDRV